MLDSVATTRQNTQAAGFAALLGVFLAAGFLPVSQSLVDHLAGPFFPDRPRVLAWLSCLAFPLLAWAFHLSFPRPLLEAASSHPWRALSFPVILAGIYSLLDPSPGFFSVPLTPELEMAAAWSWILAPVGEEILFRGWAYSVAWRIWPMHASVTNPLPLAVWISAIAFSFWHLQNWGVDSPARVLFQMAYTLPLGLWLGWLRWKTGGLLAPCLAHAAVNIASTLT